MSSKRIKKWYLFSQTPESDMLLNPLDYFLWNDVEKRMARSAPKTAYETLVKFKERLRRTALATSPNLIRKAMLHMKKRIAAIYDAQGGDIEIDRASHHACLDMVIAGRCAALLCVRHAWSVIAHR